MNKKIILVIITVFVIMITFCEIIPIFKEKESKNRIFTDMQEKTKLAMKSIVGIIPEGIENGNTIRDGYGAGVIFERKGNTYYVVTARHVVSENNRNFKLFTIDTEFSGEKVSAGDNINFEIPDENYYESLLNTKVEYISQVTDLAILSFEYDGDLPILEFETKKLSINDRISVIGHPEGNRYKVTYGYIKSGLETFKLKDNNGIIMNHKIIKHDAYMKPGNSGGVALSDDMKIVGINFAGNFTLLGHYKTGYMIPYDIILNNINEWKKSNK